MYTDSNSPILTMKTRWVELKVINGTKNVPEEIEEINGTTTIETEAAVALLGLSGLIDNLNDVRIILSDHEREAQIEYLANKMKEVLNEFLGKCNTTLRSGIRFMLEFAKHHKKLEKEMALARIGLATQKLCADSIR
jgi:hypothetical protein